MDDKFQDLVRDWIVDTFGEDVMLDKTERWKRFFEEAVELAQSCGAKRTEVLDIANHVFTRPVGELEQEVGGVMVCLAALCKTNKISMAWEADRELLRITDPRVQEKIRAKHAAKPKMMRGDF